MSDNRVNSMMSGAMENLKQMVDVNTIVGTPIATNDGTVVIPVSKVSFGLVAGGCEFSSKKPEVTENPFGGGVGAGVSVDPVAFLVSTKDHVKLLPVHETDSISKLIDYVPTMVNKIVDLFPKKEKDE